MLGGVRHDVGGSYFSPYCFTLSPHYPIRAISANLEIALYFFLPVYPYILIIML